MKSSTLATEHTNMLLGLAWLGELDRRLILRLWFADRSESTVEKTLAKLRAAELMAVRPWSVRDERRDVGALRNRDRQRHRAPGDHPRQGPRLQPRVNLRSG
jgi:hypothetical protein